MGKSGSGGYNDYTTQASREKMQQLIDSGQFRIINVTDTEHMEVDGTVLVDTKSRTFPDFTGAVNKGAKLLDSVDPDWYTAIDTSALDLDNENMCVLGQSWNHYKVVEEAAAKGLEHSGGTNFSKFLRALAKKGKLTSWDRHDLKMESSEYGFAFPNEVYRWAHIEAQRRVDSGEEPAIDGWIDPRGYARHLTWKIDAELWEHLTKTWLVLIEARQKVKAKVDKEREEKDQKEINELVDLLYSRGMTTTSAREMAIALRKQGVTHSSLLSGESNMTLEF